MRIPRKPTARAPDLDGLVAAVQREAERVEPDPFDEALVEAVAGVVEVMRAQAAELAEIVAKQGKVTRRMKR